MSLFLLFQVCNGNSYVEIGSEDMKKAYVLKTGTNLTDQSTKEEKPLSKHSYSPINFNDLTVNGGVPLLCEYIPPSILDKVEVYFCCGTCGKIFWEGSHFDRVITQFSEVLDDSPVSRRENSFYAKENIEKQ